MFIFFFRSITEWHVWDIVRLRGSSGAFIQSTGGKDEPKTVYITNQAHVHNVTMYRKHGLKSWSDVQFGSSDVAIILISECHTLHFLNKIINKDRFEWFFIRILFPVYFDFA
jgi:hypothetical protein